MCLPLYAILVREYFGDRIMGAAFGAVSMVATLGMALGPWVGGALYDAYSSYAWMFDHWTGDQAAACRTGGDRSSVDVAAFPVDSGSPASPARSAFAAIRSAVSNPSVNHS